MSGPLFRTLGLEAALEAAQADHAAGDEAVCVEQRRRFGICLGHAHGSPCRGPGGHRAGHSTKTSPATSVEVIVHG